MKSLSLNPQSPPAPKNQGGYSNIDPLDGRYFSSDIATYLSEESRIFYQAQVEAALALTLADFDICSEEIARDIESATYKVTAEAVSEEEKSTKHDIKAMVNVIKANATDEAKPFVHFMATSNDVVNTALVLQYKNAMNKTVLPQLKSLMTTLISKTEEYAETAQVGRTHGQHAVPITFGYAVAEYVERLGNSYQKLQDLTDELKGKFSGAVGAYNAQKIFVDDPAAFEKVLLEKLGLEPVDYATQVIAPEYLVRLLDELSIAAGVMANIATDMRHLQRSEIQEVAEEFSEGQTGSSTMAQKRNPITFENIASQFKQVLAQTMNAKMNLISEHQRDLTDSAATRYYAVLLGAVSQMASKLDSSMETLVVDADSLNKNLTESQGAIAAEPLYLLLAREGVQNSHEKVKKLAHEAMDSNRSLTEVVKEDDELAEFVGKLSDEDMQLLEAPEKHYLGLSVEKAKSIAKKWQAALEAS